MIRSLSDLIDKVTGRGESSWMIRGWMRRRTGEARLSGPATAEDPMPRMRSRRRGPCRRLPSPLQEEEEEDVVPNAQASGGEDEDAVPEAQSSSDEE